MKCRDRAIFYEPVVELAAIAIYPMILLVSALDADHGLEILIGINRRSTSWRTGFAGSPANVVGKTFPTSSRTRLNCFWPAI